ncbi:VanZ family protein [Streptomonospora litoralis]|uniref:VanZ family protein n=1 Tax=Streptomonospora litoralis TaxID=2498135 RepID=UPI0013F14D25|nr:VanZ family protein [Streptomonospora litoralis]
MLVPFTDMFATGASLTTMYQSGGNIALFVPLGALLPLAFGRRAAAFGRVAVVAAVLSGCVEVVQYALSIGHIASVDDVLLNVFGALLGAALTRPFWGRVGEGRRIREESSAPG